MNNNLNNILSGIINVEEQLNKKISNTRNDSDYTCFEVAATSTVILSGNGTVSGAFTGELTKYKDMFNTYDTYLIKTDIPSGMTHEFSIRSLVSANISDVMIDWGDGIKESFNAIVDRCSAYINPTIYKGAEDDEKFHKSNYTYYIQYNNLNHTYKEQGKYIIKIYGKDYSAIMNSSDPTKNLLTRFFDTELHFASHINCLNSFTGKAYKLFRVIAPSMAFDKKQMSMFAYLFSYANNINEISNFNGVWSEEWSNANAMLVAVDEKSCLQKCDLRLPKYIYSFEEGVYNNLTELSTSIFSLLPKYGFQSLAQNGAPIYITSNVFKNCPKIWIVPSWDTGDQDYYYDKLGKLLWNNPNIEWRTYQKFFGENVGTDMPTNQFDLSKIPTSWGGTGSDDELIILNKLQKQIDELKEQI